MEKLTSLLPLELKQFISHSDHQDLELTCDQIISFLRPQLSFQRVVLELTDPQLGLCKKNREVSLEFKQKGNDCFTRGDFSEALCFYSKALRHAPTSSDDADKTLLSTVYTNRASSLLNLHLVDECKRDCSRAIVLSPQYAKAWYRRGKANIESKSYGEAVHDLEVALTLEISSSGKNQIEKDIFLALKSSKRNDLQMNSSNHVVNTTLSSPSLEQSKCLPELLCKNSDTKGRGMFSQKIIAPSTLIHFEEPLAAVILKTVRESHCHFCLTKLPRDVVFCSSCTIPFYCSEKCREAAVGKSDETQNKFYEHQHECGGSNWPAVLPSDVVLAGRLMVKNIYIRDYSLDSDKANEKWDFVHHYGEMTPEVKLELHILSLVLACCLNYHLGSRFPLTGSSAAQLVRIMSQMKVNAMAIVHMAGLQDEKILMKNIEQLRVGQAIYSTGRLFNHSCQPNIHAYFLSRRLFLRSTENVSAGSPLELSYGPEIGQWGFQERQRLLKDQYFFTCQCRGCSRVNFPDLVIDAFRCKNQDCPGAVLEGWVERENFTDLPKKGEISEVGQLLLTHSRSNIDPSSCLKCGLKFNQRQLAPVAETALLKIQRLKEYPLAVHQALEALGQLRSVRHAFSKDLAKGEDMVAEIFCLGGNLESAQEHCKASIRILEKLYHERHIVIGNELVKLASIQLSLGDRECALEAVDRLRDIFSLYYGTHAEQVNPYLVSLRVFVA